MKARKIGHGYYEVVDGEKWYTASLLTNGLWFVVNHRGTAIRQQSAVHRRVIAAINSDS